MIAGQAGVGIELAEQVPDLRRVVVPVGGGGLASGIALAIKLADPGIEVIGVQAAGCAAMAESLARRTSRSRSAPRGRSPTASP